MLKEPEKLMPNIELVGDMMAIVVAIARSSFRVYYLNSDNIVQSRQYLLSFCSYGTRSGLVILHLVHTSLRANMHQ